MLRPFLSLSFLLYFFTAIASKPIDHKEVLAHLARATSRLDTEEIIMYHFESSAEVASFLFSISPSYYLRLSEDVLTVIFDAAASALSPRKFSEHIRKQDLSSEKANQLIQLAWAARFREARLEELPKLISAIRHYKDARKGLALAALLSRAESLPFHILSLKPESRKYASAVSALSFLLNHFRTSQLEGIYFLALAVDKEKSLFEGREEFSLIMKTVADILAQAEPGRIPEYYEVLVEIGLEGSEVVAMSYFGPEQTRDGKWMRPGQRESIRLSVPPDIATKMGMTSKEREQCVRDGTFSKFLPFGAWMRIPDLSNHVYRFCPNECTAPLIIADKEQLDYELWTGFGPFDRLISWLLPEEIHPGMTIQNVIQRHGVTLDECRLALRSIATSKPRVVKPIGDTSGQ